MIFSVLSGLFYLSDLLLSLCSLEVTDTKYLNCISAHGHTQHVGTAVSCEHCAVREEVVMGVVDKTPSVL